MSIFWTRGFAMTVAEFLSTLIEVSGKSQAAISRNVAKLGNGLTMADAGARLIEAYEDPSFRRRKLVKLTALGRECRGKLLALMES